MFIDDKEVDARVSSLDNLINKLQGNTTYKKLHNGGRPKGRKNDTTEERTEVAELALTHGPTIAAQEFNTTPSRASLLSNGIVTHGLGTTSELVSSVEDKKEQVHKKAIDIIAQTLGLLDEKVKDIKKPRELASIASEMSKVAERTGSRQILENKQQVQVIVYAPRIRNEDEYDKVEI